MATPQTLASVLAPASIDMEVLRRRYGSLLDLVCRLLGVVPNCDQLLEIWPTAFRSYNLLVPTFLNLPPALFGAGLPKATVGLAMYVASRASGCAYCSAHTCSFALRRGTASEKIAAAYGSAVDDPGYTAAELAAMAAGLGLALVPSTFTSADRGRLDLYFTPPQVEWLALAIAMMGFLNKFMDALGVPLEDETAGEAETVIGASGWVPGQHYKDNVEAASALPRPDTIWTTLGVIQHAPRAVVTEGRWTAGVPLRWPAVGTYLREKTGHDFPVLGRLTHVRPRRALATMLRDNLALEDTKIGPQVKTLAGLVYATVVQNKQLAADAMHLAAYWGVPAAALNAAADFASMPPISGTEAEVAASEIALRSKTQIAESWVVALLLAKASSYSPAQITAPLIARVACQLAPEEIVELLTWIAIQQLLHRLGAFFAT